MPTPTRGGARTLTPISLSQRGQYVIVGVTLPAGNYLHEFAAPWDAELVQLGEEPYEKAATLRLAGRRISLRDTGRRHNERLRRPNRGHRRGVTTVSRGDLIEVRANKTRDHELRLYFDTTV